jgi:hypothetical protein
VSQCRAGARKVVSGEHCRKRVASDSGSAVSLCNEPKKLCCSNLRRKRVERSKPVFKPMDATFKD